MKKRLGLTLLLLAIAAALLFAFRKEVPLAIPVVHAQGHPLDSLNGVVIYCNGGFSGNAGRNVVDGYNIGLKYQCVEFVKRYYFERFDHRMPNSYGEVVG